MGIKIENTFVVSAPVDDAWRILIDVPRVVPCMPGTELTEALDDRRFRAMARLRVGPVELAFGTSAESWLNQQIQYDLWLAEKRRKSLRVSRLAA